MTDPLISRDVLFGNPDKAMARLSPDGTRVAFLAPDDGVLNVFVAPSDDLDAAEPVTADRGRGVRVFFWAYDSRHLLYLQDEGGDENWRVYRVDVATKDIVDLTPLDDVAAQIVKVSHRHPSVILVGLNDRDARWHDVHRVDLTTGERELVQQNDG
ncbi:MAG: S9 family peptidase, partial [Polyangiaceae bacterium]